MNWRILILSTLLLGLVIYLTTDKWIEVKAKNPESALSQTLIKNKILNVFRSSSVKQETTNESSAKAEMIAWVQVEAQKMDTGSFDFAAKEFELQELAKNLKAEDVQTLKQIASSRVSAANERILSTYLLIRSQSQSLLALQELAASPLSQSGVPEPHSLDETQVMHEKALRRMAIDELFQRAIHDELYRPTLAKLIESIANPEIKSYALNRFRQLFGEM